MENFDLKKSKSFLLEGDENNKAILINYFKDYPKSKALATRIADGLGEALTDDIVKDILALADGFGFETPQK